MSVIAICGLPGSGKNVLCTYFQIKHFKRQNTLFSKLILKLKKKDPIINNIYCNYPIQLYKNNFCNRLSLFDLLDFDKFPINSNICFDEFQMYFDSLDYKNFPKNIRTFFQLHRHLGINDIYIISQHPSRIVKQARVLVSEFYEVVKAIRIPFLGLMFFRYNIYYNFEDFGKPVNVKRSEVTYRFKKRFIFFRYKKIYKAYDTCYMRRLQDNKPFIDSIKFNDRSMSQNEIQATFKI